MPFEYMASAFFCSPSVTTCLFLAPCLCIALACVLRLPVNCARVISFLNFCDFLLAPLFLTDTQATQHCVDDYQDNNAGLGQVYTCPAGEFTGTLLNCTRKSRLFCFDSV